MTTRPFVSLLLALAAASLPTALSRPAAATKPSRPPVGVLDVIVEADRATATLTPHADARDLTVQIYGLTGLKAGGDNLVFLRRGLLRVGERLVIPFAIKRGPGLSHLRVAAMAGERFSEKVLALGEFSEEQRRRNNACVRRDPEGTWIKVMGCSEEGPPPVEPKIPTLPRFELAVEPPTAAFSDGATLRLDGDRVELHELEPTFTRGTKAAGPLIFVEGPEGLRELLGPSSATSTRGAACAPHVGNYAADLVDPRAKALSAADVALAGKIKLVWHAFRDAGCTQPVDFTVLIERGPSPNRTPKGQAVELLPSAARPLETNPAGCQASSGPLSWSCAGPIAGLACTQISEPSDPHAWNDNYLCTSQPLGLRWSFAGPIEGMRCTQINEPSEPPEHTWNDNYLCVPPDSSYRFQWSYRGPIPGPKVNCLRFSEPSDPHTWNDNYLCWQSF